MTSEEILWLVAVVTSGIALALYVRALISLVIANKKLRARKLQAMKAAQRAAQIARAARDAGFADRDKNGS